MITSKEAIDLIDQQKQIPHPINPICVHIIKDIIYYDDLQGRLWALIQIGGQTMLAYREKKSNIFYLVE